MRSRSDMPSERRSIAIRRVASLIDEERCARLMSTSEPWVSLGREYGASMRVVRDPDAEVYVGEDAGEFVGFVVLSLVGVLNGYIRSVRYVGELTDFFASGVSELLYRKTRGPWSDFSPRNEI